MPDHSTNSGKQTAVRRFQRGVLWIAILRTALAAMTAGAFLWGILLLAVRIFSGRLPFSPFWGLSALAPLMLLSIAWNWRRRPGQAAVRALLDRRNKCGGLLAASGELDLGAWRQSLPDLRVPRLIWHWQRPAAGLALAALFLAGAVFLPLPNRGIPAELPFQIEAQAEDLSQKIETLLQEEIMEEELAQSMQRQLEDLRQNSAGDDPLRTWEALDDLDRQARQAAQEAAQQWLGSTEQMAQAEMLAEGLSDGSELLSSKLQSEALQELSSLLKDRQAAQSLQGLDLSQLDSPKLRRLADRLHRRKRDLQSRLERVQQVELIDSKYLRQLKEAGQCRSAGLADYLARNGDSASVSEMLRAWATPGSGGIDRGRADAPLTKRSDFVEHGYDFKEVALPPSSLQALQDSQLVGLSLGTPEPSSGQGGSQGGALGGVPAGEARAATHTLLPRHRGAVERFFKRSGSGEQQPR